MSSKLEEAILEAYKEDLVNADFVIEGFSLFKKKKNKDMIYAKDMPGGMDLLKKLESYTNSNITLPKDFESFAVQGGFFDKKTGKFDVRITYTDSNKKKHELSGDNYDNIRKQCGAMMLKHRDSVPDDKKYNSAYFQYYNKNDPWLTVENRANLVFNVRKDSD